MTRHTGARMGGETSMHKTRIHSLTSTFRAYDSFTMGFFLGLEMVLDGCLQATI